MVGGSAKSFIKTTEAKLMKWLKKDNVRDEEREALKRRQSAPPSWKHNRDQIVDEAYVKAFQKFNNWRRTQSVDYENQINSDSDLNDSLYTRRIPSRISEEDENLLSNATDVTDLENTKSPKNFPRHSMPAIRSRPDTSVRKTKYSPGTNTIYETEIDEFESQHCTSNYQDLTTPNKGSNSPPKNFYKANATPFANCLETPEEMYASIRQSQPLDNPTPTPRSSIISGRFNRRQKEKTVKEKRSDEGSPFLDLNGSYKKYEITSSSIEDDRVISSKAYTGTMKSQNSIGKTETITKNNSIGLTGPKPRPPTYQICNKYGELVEYALLTTDPIPPSQSSSDEQLKKKIDAHIQNDVRLQENAEIQQCEAIVNDNFSFLDTDRNEDFREQQNLESPNLLNNGFLSDQSNIVTNLDDTSLNNTENIMNELESLKQWSDKVRSGMKQKSYGFKSYQQAKSVVMICFPREIEYKFRPLKESFHTPLELKSAEFRGSEVVIRKYTYDEGKMLKRSICERALKRDLEILCQLRHPSIAILMALCYDHRADECALILEPASFTLFYYMHQAENMLTGEECFNTVRHMASAINYLHESGYIHTNVSSHNVLIRFEPFCAKLTAFELTVDNKPEMLNELKDLYPNKVFDNYDCEDYRFVPDSRLIDRASRDIKMQYRKMSKQLYVTEKTSPKKINEKELDVSIMPTKCLPYLMDYRKRFSTYYHQAPELLTSNFMFVCPSKASDLYGLGLLLWEVLNDAVPFVIYKSEELETLYRMKQVNLPIIDDIRMENCGDLLKDVLEANPHIRQMSVKQFIANLAIIQNKSAATKDNSQHQRTRSFSPDVIEELRDKFKNNINEADYMTPKVTRHRCSRQVTPNESEHKQEYHILNSSGKSTLNYKKFVTPQAGEGIRPRTSTMKKKRKTIRELNQSGLYKADNGNASSESQEEINEIYAKSEKKMKKAIQTEPKPRYEGILRSTDGPVDNSILLDFLRKASGRHNSFKKLNFDGDEYKDDEIEQITKPVIVDTLPKVKPGSSPMVQKLPQYKPIMTDDKTPTKTVNGVEPRKYFNSPDPLKESENDKASYKFHIDNVYLPKNPIARKNTIRRYNWLSDRKLKPTVNSGPEIISQRSKTPDNIVTKTEINEPVHVDAANKALNVSIKIIHNKQDQYLLSPSKSQIKEEKSYTLLTPPPHFTDKIRIDTSPSVVERVRYFNKIRTTPDEKFDTLERNIEAHSCKKDTKMEIAMNPNHSEDDNRSNPDNLYANKSVDAESQTNDISIRLHSPIRQPPNIVKPPRPSIIAKKSKSNEHLCNESPKSPVTPSQATMLFNEELLKQHDSIKQKSRGSEYNEAYFENVRWQRERDICTHNSTSSSNRTSPESGDICLPDFPRRRLSVRKVINKLEQKYSPVPNRVDRINDRKSIDRDSGIQPESSRSIYPQSSVTTQTSDSVMLLPKHEIVKTIMNYGPLKSSERVDKSRRRTTDCIPMYGVRKTCTEETTMKTTKFMTPNDDGCLQGTNQVIQEVNITKRIVSTTATTEPSIMVQNDQSRPSTAKSRSTRTTCTVNFIARGQRASDIYVASSATLRSRALCGVGINSNVSSPESNTGSLVPSIASSRTDLNSVSAFNDATISQLGHLMQQGKFNDILLKAINCSCDQSNRYIPDGLRGLTVENITFGLPAGLSRTISLRSLAALGITQPALERRSSLLRSSSPEVFYIDDDFNGNCDLVGNVDKVTDKSPLTDEEYQVESTDEIFNTQDLRNELKEDYGY